MQCRRIRLRDFRNVEEAEVHFSPGVNLLHGDNAQGKTNLLEALYYTALGKTFRTGHDEELIRFGAESAMIENCFSPAETVGQAGQAGQADSTLLFRLLRGRGGRLDPTAEQWSAQLASACAEIAAKRAGYILRLDSLMRDCFADMTGNREIPGVGYTNSLGLPAQEMLSPEDTAPAYFRLLTERTAREIGAGSTLYGVHRDDLALTLNDRPARLYASQGQQRSIALAMKLAEGTVSGQETGGDLPVFLFDDVLSELDSRRRSYLLRELSGRQVIMTCCEDISSSFSPDSFRSIRVENGKYFE